MVSIKDQVLLRENHGAKSGLSKVGEVLNMHGSHSSGGCKKVSKDLSVKPVFSRSLCVSHVRVLFSSDTARGS